MEEPHGAIPAEYWATFRHALVWKAAPDEVVERLARTCRVRSCATGEVLALEGSVPDESHIVLRGSVRAVMYDETGQTVVLDVMEAGYSVGVIPAALDMPLAATAEAGEDTVIATLPASTVRELYRSDRDVAGSIAMAMAHRYVGLAGLIKLNAKSVPRRVASYLLTLPAETSSPNQRVVRTPFSRHMLADLLATSPETLSRTFRALQDKGLIESSERMVTILDVRGLEAFSADSDAV